MTAEQIKRIFTLQISQLKRNGLDDSQVKDYFIKEYSYSTKDFEYLIILDVLEEMNLERV